MRTPAEPWLWHYRDLLEDLGADPWGCPGEQFVASCNALARARRLPISFVRPRSNRKSLARMYEERIVSSGEVETRATLHDSVNALVWLRFPLTKLAISRLHVAEFATRADRTRTRRQDAATLLDEHGLIFIARDPIWLDHLRHHRWTRMWIDEREAFLAATESVVFGHGLLARLPNPHRALTAHALPLLTGDGVLGAVELDMRIARTIEALAGPADLMPLPVMGLPGWSTGQDDRFYGDSGVFRAPLAKRGELKVTGQP
jgi:hypothetical protein